MSPTMQQTGLAYDRTGTGVPIVLLPGLTFTRSSWRPIAQRLADGFCTIAVDLPAHGESPGPPCDPPDVAAQTHALLERLEVAGPIVVGHSMSGGIGMTYAASYPVRGVVAVDSPFDVRPFARLVRSIAPALRGPGFAEAFERFESTMGLDLIPEPLRAATLGAHEVRQDVVVGYWDMLMRTDPEELQRQIERTAAAIRAPCLAVYGRKLPDEERAYLRTLTPDAQLEEWAGSGHCVHLADPDRFTARLRAFAEACERPRP